MAKRKRRKKGNIQNLKRMLSPTKEFEFENPEDPEELIFFTARKLSPGHLLQLNNTTLIRAYKEKLEREAEDTEVSETEDQADNETEAAEVEALDHIFKEMEYCAEITSLALIDPDTEEQLLTKEECMLYLLPDWNTKIAVWALNGARPRKEAEDADDVDQFPEQVGGQEPQELEEPPAGDNPVL